jgi:hypothetical protein
MPYADLTGLERDRRLGAITDLFTVDLVVRYVTWKLRRGGPPEPGPLRESLSSAARADPIK